MRVCGICFRVALGGGLIVLALPSGLGGARNGNIGDSQIDDNES